MIPQCLCLCLPIHPWPCRPQGWLSGWLPAWRPTSMSHLKNVEARIMQCECPSSPPQIGMGAEEGK